MSSMKQMLSIETNYQSRLDYFNTSISPDSRHTLLDWLLQLIKQEKLPIDVFHVSVRLFDQLMSLLNKFNFDTNQSMLQLFGASCLFIASKLRSPQPISSIRLVQYSDCQFSLNQLIDCEQFVLQNLKWDTESVTPNDFFDFICLHLNLADKLHLADNFNVLSIICKFDQQLACYPTSTITLSSLLSILNKSNMLDTTNKVYDLLLELNIDVKEIQSVSKSIDACNNYPLSLFHASLQTQDLLDLAIFKEFLDEELSINNSTHFSDSTSDTSDLTKSFDESFTFLLTPPVINFQRVQTY